MAISFTLNGKSQSVDVSPDMPLLWVLRDTLNMTGTKFGCGMALCGACTVHINGEATRSCITPISSIAGNARDWRDAGARGLAVDVDGAGSAERHAAPKLRPGHVQRIAEHPEQRHVRADVHGL